MAHQASESKDEGKLIVEWKDIKLSSETIKIKRDQSDCIKIKRNIHSQKDMKDETKKQYKYLHTVAAEYVKSSCSEWQLLPDFENPNGKRSVLGLVGIGLTFAYIAPYIAHSGFTFFRNTQEDMRLTNNKNYNVKVELFNTKLEQLKQLETVLIEKKTELAQQEQKINNYQFKIEQNPCSRVVVCIGPTGYGKSVVCNRLIGNEEGIDDLEESEKAIFNVAEYGETKSETKKLDKHIKAIIYEQKSFYILSVVDTPGAFDSSGGDITFQNQMAEYFRASGGVNMFCIFFKFPGKIDQNYKDLLQMYSDFWGIDFWEHCVIIITNCDKSNAKLKRALPKTMTRIRQFLADMNVSHNVPIYQFGKGNFEASTRKLLLSLVNTENKYNNKYKCDQIMSPIDKLCDEINPMVLQHQSLQKQLNTLL